MINPFLADLTRGARVAKPSERHRAVELQRHPGARMDEGDAGGVQVHAGGGGVGGGVGGGGGGGSGGMMFMIAGAAFFFGSGLR